MLLFCEVEVGKGEEEAGVKEGGRGKGSMYGLGLVWKMILHD